MYNTIKKSISLILAPNLLILFVLKLITTYLYLLILHIILTSDYFQGSSLSIPLILDSQVTFMQKISINYIYELLQISNNCIILTKNNTNNPLGILKFLEQNLDFILVSLSFISKLISGFIYIKILYPLSILYFIIFNKKTFLLKIIKYKILYYLNILEIWFLLSRAWFLLIFILCISIHTLIAITCSYTLIETLAPQALTNNISLLFFNIFKNNNTFLEQFYFIKTSYISILINLENNQKLTFIELIKGFDKITNSFLTLTLYINIFTYTNTINIILNPLYTFSVLWMGTSYSSIALIEVSIIIKTIKSFKKTLTAINLNNN